MSRKKRMFDIEMPEDDVAEPRVSTLEPGARRSPMASAITENAAALKIRADAEQAIRDENDALAHEYVAAKAAGDVVVRVDLDEVRSELLVRDRLDGEDDDLDSLIASIRETGLSNPIRVVPRPDGTGFELVQGFRRLTAYRRLRDAGQGDWDRIPALVLPGAPDVTGLYRRMVDENVIRKDLSFAEMAHAAQAFAADPATEAGTLDDAIATLYASAPYSKRSYIRSFAYVLEQVGDVLSHPTEVSRAVGLKVARWLKEHPEMIPQMRRDLQRSRDLATQMVILSRYGGGERSEAPTEERAKSSEAGKGRATRTKTTFHLKSTAGQVKCTAGPGRLEIKVDRDFSTIDRAKLEAAIAELVDGLA